MKLTACFRSGLVDAARRPRLVATVWALNLALALAAMLPLAAWLYEVLPHSPEADLLAHRFSFGSMGELVQDAGPALAQVWAAVAGAALLAFLGGPLVAGGVLEVLGTADERPFFHRFFRGGGHFYGRFLRLALLSTLGAALLAAVAAALLRAALRPLRESAWEPGGTVAALIVLAAVLAIGAWCWIGLDYARIHVSRDDSRRMWRAWMSGLRFAARFRGRTFGLLGLSWLLMLVLAAAYTLFRQAVPSHTTALIVLMILAQQAFMVARTGLRIALVASQRHQHVALRPAVGLPAPPLPVPLPPSSVEAALRDDPAAAMTALEKPIVDPSPAPARAD